MMATVRPEISRSISAITAKNMSSKIRKKSVVDGGSILKGSPADHIGFGDAIRFGNEDDVYKFMKQHSPDVLLSCKFSFSLNMDVNPKAKPDKKNSDSTNSAVGAYELTNISENRTEDGTMRQVDATMTVMPLHLAIIAKHDRIVQMMLKTIWDTSKKRIETLGNVLNGKTSIDFTKYESQYEKDGLSHDGMNCFHLCAKYCAPAMKEIFTFLNAHHLLDRPSIKMAIDAKTNHVNQTPLHVAAQCSTPGMAR